MKIVVLIKMVPDLVEELSISPSGTELDTTWLRLKINEFDDHAIEQAILLKEQYGGEVTVLAPEMEGVDDALFTAAAKGADRLIQLSGKFDNSWNNHALARAFLPLAQELQPDLVLTGVQAHNDLDGSLGPLVAALMGLPYVGYVAGVTVSDGVATIRKEYPAGLLAEMEVSLPAVLGIQAAEQPPRYVAFSKVRQSMKTTTLDERPAGESDPQGGVTVEHMFQPETGEGATMLEGDLTQVTDKLVSILHELDVI